MRVRTNVLYALLILVIMGALVLAGCGTAATATPPPTATTAAPPTAVAPATEVPAATAAPTAAPAATEVPTQAPAATQAAAPKLSGSITVDFMASGTYDKAAQELAADFQKSTGVKVNVAAFPWATLRQNNTNDLLTGAAQYDVMSGGYYLADVYDYFQPLTDLIKRDNYGAGIVKGLMDPGRSEWYKGQQIGIPYGVDSYGVLYRTDLFEAAGIDPGSVKTWDDFAAAAKKLNDANKANGISGYVFSYGAGEQLPGLFMADYAGTYVDASGKYALEADKATAAIARIPTLLPYAPSNAKALSIDEANAVFLDGKAAMLIGWPSFVWAAADDTSKSKVVGKWALMPMPGDGFPWLSQWQMFLPKQAKNKDAAWEWMKQFTSEENSKKFFTEYGIGSCYESLYKDPEILQKHGQMMPAAVASLARAKNPPLSGEAQDFLASTLGQVVTGQIDAAGAVKQINDKWATLTVPPALLEAAAGAGLQAK